MGVQTAAVCTSSPMHLLPPALFLALQAACFFCCQISCYVVFLSINSNLFAGLAHGIHL